MNYNHDTLENSKNTIAAKREMRLGNGYLVNRIRDTLYCFVQILSSMHVVLWLQHYHSLLSKQ